MKKLLLLTALHFFSGFLFAQIQPDFCGEPGDEPPGCLFCSIFTGSNEGFTPDISPPGFCGNVENNLWLSFLANRDSYTFNLLTLNCQNNMGLQMMAFDMNLEPVSDCFSSGGLNSLSGKIHLHGLVPGEFYMIMIDGFAGDVCDFVIYENPPIRDPKPIIPDINVSPVCPGAVVCYSVEPTSVLTIAYSWVIPSFGEIVSGQGTNEICVQWKNTGVGNIRAFEIELCQDTFYYGSLQIRVESLPPTIFPLIFICSNEFPYHFDGRVFNAPGAYSFRETSVLGCDSIIRYAILQTPQIPSVIDTTICEGDSLVFGGRTFYAGQSGSVALPLTTFLGCDSIVVVNTHARDPMKIDIDTTICDGLTFEVGGRSFSQAGYYEFIDVCDTILLNLSVMDQVLINNHTDSIFCADTCVVLTVDASLFSNDIITNWSANSGIFTSQPGSFTGTACGDDIYSLTFFDTATLQSCIVNTIVTDRSVPLGVIDLTSFTPDNTYPLCTGELIIFHIDSVAGADDYVWQFSVGAKFISQNGNEITLQIESAGMLEVCVYALNLCNTGQTICKTFEIHETPVPAFSVAPTTCIGDPVTVNFIGSAGTQAAFDWFFGGGIINSGVGSGPFEIVWNSQGQKTLSLGINDRGCVTNSGPNYVNVFSNPPNPLFDCNPDYNSLEINWATQAGLDYQFRILSGQMVSTSNTNFIRVENLGDNEEVVLELTTISPVCPARIDTFSCRSLGCTAYPIDIQLLGPFCQNDPVVQLNATVGGNPPPIMLNWAGEGVISGGRFSPELAGPGMHQIQVYFESNGCSYAEVIIVEVFALPDITSQITPAGIWFPGTNIGAIDLEINNGTPPFTYLWDNFATTQDLTGLGPGRYCLFLEDGNGCRERYCYTVTGGFYKISPFHLLCRGDSKRLSIRPQTGAAFKWSPADGLSCTNCPNPIASPNQTTEYTVTATLPGGFSESTNVNVVVLPPPFCDFAQSREFETEEELRLFLKEKNFDIEPPSAENAVNIYPNPSTGVLTIQSFSEILEIEILDNLGRRMERTMPQSSEVSMNFDAKNGQYIFKIVTRQGVCFKKVIIEK